MRYLSVCSGIEAATVAWHSLGWEAAAFSEIEEFPRSILQHHYPTISLHGDFTTIGKKDYGTIDLLVGGTPCQAFSVAGLRKGFADDRGNLTLAFLHLLKRKTPKWVVWENVPGVLSHDRGRTFAAFLGGLGECGYGFAYRILNSQYFGVPQERRRLFVIGCLGDWRSAAEVLFEPESLQWDIGSYKTKGGESASRIIKFSGKKANGYENLIDCNQSVYCFDGQKSSKFSMPIKKNKTPCITKSHADLEVLYNCHLRKLTPLEVERCFGFPDNYTNIPGATDGKRYQALGNSMVVPVMRWIGKRIHLVNNNSKEKQ